MEHASSTGCQRQAILFVILIDRASLDETDESIFPPSIIVLDFFPAIAFPSRLAELTSRAEKIQRAERIH